MGLKLNLSSSSGNEAKSNFDCWSALSDSDEAIVAEVLSDPKLFTAVKTGDSSTGATWAMRNHLVKSAENAPAEEPMGWPLANALATQIV